MHDALRVHDDFDAVVRQPKEKVRLDDLERFVRQCRAVDGDLLSHPPRGMAKRVLDGRAFELVRRPLPKRTARRGDDDTTHLDTRPARDALQDRAMLTVDRNQLPAASPRG